MPALIVTAGPILVQSFKESQRDYPSNHLTDDISVLNEHHITQVPRIISLSPSARKSGETLSPPKSYYENLQPTVNLPAPYFPPFFTA